MGAPELPLCVDSAIYRLGRVAKSFRLLMMFDQDMRRVKVRNGSCGKVGSSLDLGLGISSQKVLISHGSISHRLILATL